MDDLHADRGMTWFGKMRMRAFASVAIMTLAVWGAAALAPAWLAWSIATAAVAAATVTVGKITQRIGRQTCWTCGADLSSEPVAAHGVACPGCGSVNLNPRPELVLPGGADDGADGSETTRV